MLTLVDVAQPHRALALLLPRLAGDRNGVSFYAHNRICAALALTLDEHLSVSRL